MTDLLIQSTIETLLMVGGSTLIGLVVGVPLAVLLVLTGPGGLWKSLWFHHSLSAVVNAVRSIPYIIMMVLMIPLTRFLVGTSIGTWAALIPLSLASILLIAREAQGALRVVPKGLVESGLAMGAPTGQIVRKIMLSEALPTITSGTTTVVINIIGFSAMAGAVGGGGLGDLAIRYGYQRYDLTLLLIIVVILIVLVQLVQSFGEFLARRFTK